MQLWQKTTNNLAIENLWQKTQADIKKMFQPDSLCTQRFLPYQYLSVLQDEILLSGMQPERIKLLTDKIFLHRITGGHPELQHLLKVFGYTPDAGNFTLWGHKITEILGRGSSSVVYCTDEHYALKVVSASGRDKLFQEYIRISGIKCNNIVNAYDFYESTEGAGMLLEQLSSPSCDTNGYICGLDYLHQIGLCHGDIRYSNLGSDNNGTAKLFDLGNCFYGTTGSMQKEKKDLRLLLEKFNRVELRNDY